MGIVPSNNLKLEPGVLVRVAQLAQVDGLLSHPRVCRIEFTWNIDYNGEPIRAAWNFLQDLGFVKNSLGAHAHAATSSVLNVLPS